MPKASAPKAPWVEVWLSPQTTVMPGWVSPSCGPTTCTMPWSASPIGIEPDAELLAVAAQRLDLGPAHRVGDRPRGGGDVVVLGREREVGAADRAARQPQPVEGLRAGHLVEQVEVDVEEVGLPLGPTHHVRVPHLLGQCSCHVLPPSPPSWRRLVGSRHGDWCARTSHAGGHELASQAMRRQYQCMDNSSGVGVLDKAAIVLGALEAGPSTLAQLVGATGLARPTAHRLAVALEHHRLVSRDMQGRFVLGPRLGELASAAGEDRLLAAAGPVLGALRDHTNESAQLFRAPGRPAHLRRRGRAPGRPARLHPGRRQPVDAGRVRRPGAARLGGARPAAPRAAGRQVHGDHAVRGAPPRLGPERRRARAGVASVSAPVRGPSGRVVAAVSISGPIERLSRQPGRLHAATVVAGANKLTEVLRRAQQASQASS